MFKKIGMIAVALLAVVALAGCWPGEIGVETTFEDKDGGGSRTIVLDVMDDTLSDEPIINPDDPDQDEDKGPVLNDKHIDGGVPAIQTWLEDNAPDFITVEEMSTEGVHRYFTMTYAWEDFEEFQSKYEQLVNLSPNMSWDDFDDQDKPSWTCDGAECTFTESRAILEASMDWAVDGIWNDIYDEADLAGYVTKADISVLANYVLTVDGETYEEHRYYDAEAEDGDYTGKVIFVESDSFSETGEFPMSGWAIGGIVAAAVLVVAGVVYFVVIKKH
jgi:hypothetical protein